MRRAFWLLCLLQLACLRREAPTRLTEATPIAVAILHESATALSLLPVPDELRARIEEGLAVRNVIAVEADPEVVGKAGRASGQRLVALGAGAAKVPLLLLVEAKATYYEALQGRFRWVVSAKLTAQRQGELASEASVDVEVPVFLLFHHEGPQEALRAAADGISQRATQLVEGLAARPPALPQTGR